MPTRPVTRLFGPGTRAEVRRIAAILRTETTGGLLLLGAAAVALLWVNSPWSGAYRFTQAGLASGIGWWDVLGLAPLGGVGFTVSLLIGELAFGAGTPRDEHAKLGVLVGSAIAAIGAAVLLRVRDRHHRRRRSAT